MNKILLIIGIVLLGGLTYWGYGYYKMCKPIEMRIYLQTGNEVNQTIYPCGETSQFLEKILPKE